MDQVHSDEVVVEAVHAEVDLDSTLISDHVANPASLLSCIDTLDEMTFAGLDEPDHCNFPHALNCELFKAKFPHVVLQSL